MAIKPNSQQIANPASHFLNMDLAICRVFPTMVVRGSPPLAPAAGLEHVAMALLFANAAVLIIPARKLISAIPLRLKRLTRHGGLLRAGVACE
jgi:hypothetical protein